MATRYKAYISYSHADERWAKWLHNALERYRVPRRVAEMGDGKQPLPKRLYPVFRDRSELSSSSDLGASLQDALRESENLVVVCSPAAATSKWLNEEIRFFKSLGRGDRIFCFMVDGSPDANAEDCAFPPELIETDDAGTLVEHLAADPRKDGKRNAFLKIVGGILGVGIDDLKQRDAQRRMRVLVGLTTVSAMVAIAMIFLTLFAMAARQEAELRRGQAEDLISFMLGDLRSRLEPIGKLDLLDAVGDEAMEYFEALDDNATSQDLFSRAMALRQIGEVRFAQRHLEPALAAFVESHAVLQRLSEQEPGIDEYRFELGQSAFWVGYVHYERSRFDEARIAMESYMAIGQELLERQPENQVYLSELAYAYSNLGSVARSQGDTQSAIQFFRESALINEQQLEQEPDNSSLITDLAGGYSWIGSAEQDLGNLTASEEAFRRALELFRTAYGVTNDVRTEEEIATMRLLLASTLVLQGRVEHALTEAAPAYTSYKTLIAGDPANGRWRRGAAEAARRMGELSLYLGIEDEVLPYLDESLALYQSIARLDPSDSDTRIRYAAVLATRAGSLLSAENRDASADHIVRALQTINAIPEDDRGSKQFASTLASIAIVHERVFGASGTSMTLVERAYAPCKNWADASLFVKALLARLARLLGEFEEANALEAQLRSMGYAHPVLWDVSGMGPDAQ